MFAGLALILDLSGSMEQRLFDKTKRQVMVDNISALATTHDKTEDLLIVSFGATQDQSCKVVKSENVKAGQLGHWIARQRPRKFAKTPLALSLRSLLVPLTEKKISQIIAVTDGNDTCNENPCQVISELDQKIGPQSVSVQIDLIGYDLDTKERKQLDCDTSTLRNLKYSVHLARTDVGLTTALQNVTRNAQAKKKDATSIQVMNSPPNSTFKIKHLSKDGKVLDEKVWKGPFPLNLAAGEYEVSLLGPDGKELGSDVSDEPNAAVGTGSAAKGRTRGTQGKPKRITIDGRQKASINFADLAPPASKITLEGPVLGFLATPVGDTETKPINLRSPGDYELTPGMWRLQLNYPQWLSQVPGFEVAIEAGSDKKFDIEKDLKKEIQWVKLPEGRAEAMLEFTLGGKLQKILVLRQSPAIPLPHGVAYSFKDTTN